MKEKRVGTGTDNRRPTESDPVECSSPPCMLHELDLAFVQHAGRGQELPWSPEADAATLQDWEEIRLWRKAKRTVLIKQRIAMSAEKRTACTEAITAALFHILPIRRDLLIGFYWPFKGEYDPRPLARFLYGEGVRLALPVVVEKAKPLIFREWWPGIPMTRGVWNIPIPTESEPVLPDVLLAPLVGFDNREYRLGYGGGYYDRTLAALPAKPRTVGVGFELSRIATIHPQPHDIPMDLIVTERKLL